MKISEFQQDIVGVVVCINRLMRNKKVCDKMSLNYTYSMVSSPVE